LTFFAVSIVTFLLGYVVPMVTEVFSSMKAQLPIATQILIGVSNYVQSYGLWTAVVLAAVIAFTIYRLRQLGPKRRFHRFLLRVPLVGRLVRGSNTARFTRTLAILTASAVPVLEALRIAGEVVTNVPMREAVAEAAARIREGAPIGRSLAASKLFPPMTIHLISSGETSGELEAMLERAAANQDRELDSLITALLGLLGPALIVGMGLFVMGIVMALLLPIFQLNDLVR
ncbi:MAG: type II secretion system F family protein, partial [Steroidobacteraceae bacterium]